MTVTLHTPRLTLRPLTLADFPAYRDFWATERSQFMGGPHGPRQAWFWFCHDLASWPLHGFGGFAIEAGGQTVGRMGMNAGPIFPENEMGWSLYAGHEGQGYATEAAGAVRDWALGARGLPTLVSYIAEGNAASAAVAMRLGAELDPDAPSMGPNVMVYRHRVRA
jgi:RimJ/RimL family protein N-acetyltransferase